MSNYKSVLNTRESLENSMALALLLEHGKRHLLDDEYYKKMKKELEKNDEKAHPFITTDYLKRSLEISRKMASMEATDIYDYIQKEVYVYGDNEQEKENEKDSPDYDY